jgi:hypothetical protein
MVLAALFSLAIVSAGFATLRILGLAKGAVALGLVAPTGVAVLATLSTWCAILGAPSPTAGVVVLGVALSGLGLGLADRRSILLAARTLVREQQLTLTVLVAAVAVPYITMSIAFAGAQVPLLPHDGASHVETIQALRNGQTWSGWYPPGVACLFAAWMELFPFVDSAMGAFELGLSVPMLAALAVFGLGVAVWRDLRMARPRPRSC